MTGKIINRRVIPDRYEIFENDNNVKSIVFSVSKINDGVDLSNLYAFVNLENENFATNKVLLSKEIVGDDITLTFNIDNAISVVDGITKAQISFENSDLSIVYSTSIFYVDVKSSIDSYQNTMISAKALYDLQNELTKTIDGINERVSEAIEEAKSKFTFAELNIDGVVYDGSQAKTFKHLGPTIKEFPAVFTSGHDGYLDTLSLYGIYDYEGKDVVFGDGIDSCVVKGLGDKINDATSEYNGKYRIRLSNSNGNFYEPLNDTAIQSGTVYVKPYINSGSIYIKSEYNEKAVIEVPIKQHFKRNTYYNLKLEYVSGQVACESTCVVLAISIYNKTTKEEKKINIQHSCAKNVEMQNYLGERFFTGSEGEICIRVHVNTKDTTFARFSGVLFTVVIEESDNPVEGYPLRKVEHTDIYLNEPLYKIENYDSQTGEFIDGVYDELDLKNSRVIRRVVKARAEQDNLYYDEERVWENQMWLDSYNIVTDGGVKYNNKDCAFRPNLNIKSPKASDIHNYMYFESSGIECFLDMNYFGHYYNCSASFPFVFFYPLREPFVEKITPIKIPYNKGVNCFNVECEYPAEKVLLKV